MTFFKISESLFSLKEDMAMMSIWMREKFKQIQCDDRTKGQVKATTGPKTITQFSTLFWTNPSLSTFFISTNEMF
jgi:hypothetical protein